MCEAKMDGRENRNKSIVTTGDFNTSLSTMEDGWTENHQECRRTHNTINQHDLINISILQHPKTVAHIHIL